MNADRRWTRQARSAIFFCILGGIRPSYSWILAYVELERKNQGTAFQIGIISTLESKFLPDDAFFMAASNRLPYRSYYYCCVSLPFGSVGIVLYNQRRICSEYDSHRDHIWYSGACALETVWMVMILVSVLLSTTHCSTWKGDSSVDPFELINDRKHIWLVFKHNPLSYWVTWQWVVLCVVSSILTDFIFVSFKRARWRHSEWFFQ